MATHLDLEEQEQLDQLKHVWSRFGGLITTVLTVSLLAYAGWNAWRWYQAEQASKAAMVYDALEVAAQAKDLTKVSQALGDLKSQYPGTTWATQGAMLAAQAMEAQGKPAEALEALEWVNRSGQDPQLAWISKLRAAGLHLDANKPDAALAVLEGQVPQAYEGLVADRRGDAFQKIGKPTEAIAAYQQAWKSLDGGLDYRRLVEIKLTALGVEPVRVVPAVESGAGR